jgi:hypothetical protein
VHHTQKRESLRSYGLGLFCLSCFFAPTDLTRPSQNLQSVTKLWFALSKPAQWIAQETGQSCRSVWAGVMHRT